MTLKLFSFLVVALAGAWFFAILCKQNRPSLLQPFWYLQPGMVWKWDSRFWTADLTRSFSRDSRGNNHSTDGCVLLMRPTVVLLLSSLALLPWSWKLYNIVPACQLWTFHANLYLLCLYYWCPMHPSKPSLPFPNMRISGYLHITLMSSRTSNISLVLKKKWYISNCHFKSLRNNTFCANFRASPTKISLETK